MQLVGLGRVNEAAVLFLERHVGVELLHEVTGVLFAEAGALDGVGFL